MKPVQYINSCCLISYSGLTLNISSEKALRIVSNERDYFIKKSVTIILWLVLRRTSSIFGNINYYLG